MEVTPQRIVWTEGMFMSPQHMQQLDLYHERLLGVRMGAVAPFEWGVVSLAIEENSLAGGAVVINQVEAILPEGTPLAVHGAGGETIASRPFEDHFLPTARILEVFLGIRREREGGDNYAPPGRELATMRYAQVERQVLDLTNPQNTAPVMFARRNARILFGDEPREDFDCLKIAEIVRTSNGSFALRGAYIPPCLRISASEHLIAQLKELLTLLSARIRDLSSGRRQRGRSVVEYAESDVTRYLLLTAVSSALPLVQSMVDLGVHSPLSAYTLLIGLIGQLSAFADDSEELTEVPRFLYMDLDRSFTQVFARLRKLLQTVVQENYLVVPFRRNDRGVCLGQLHDERLMDARAYILAVRSPLPEEKTAKRIKLAKIASWKDLSQQKEGFLRGVPLTMTLRPPSEIPVRPDVVYFNLDTKSEYWANICRDRKIAIFPPPDLRGENTEFELLVVPR